MSEGYIFQGWMSLECPPPERQEGRVLGHREGSLDAPEKFILPRGCPAFWLVFLSPGNEGGARPQGTFAALDNQYFFKEGVGVDGGTCGAMGPPLSLPPPPPGRCPLPCSNTSIPMPPFGTAHWSAVGGCVRAGAGAGGGTQGSKGQLPPGL